MRIKVVSPNGEGKVHCFSEAANVYDLLEEVKPHKVFVNRDRRMHLDTFDPITPLAALGIQNLDTLHILPLHSNPIPLESNSKAREFCLKEMPDDNSCLFRAIAFVTGSLDDPGHQRQLIHDHILLNRLQWNRAVLGEDPDEYARWILQKNSWGGAIELAIFSELYTCEICCLDVQTQRMLKFGEDKYQKRVFVVYSGIHYDAIYETKGDLMVREFPVDDQEAVEKVMQVVETLHVSHAYTDVANFSLKCDICGAKLKGEKEAELHATQTKHFSFSELNS